MVQDAQQLSTPNWNTAADRVSPGLGRDRRYLGGLRPSFKSGAKAAALQTLREVQTCNGCRRSGAFHPNVSRGSQALDGRARSLSAAALAPLRFAPKQIGAF